MSIRSISIFIASLMPTGVAWASPSDIVVETDAAIALKVDRRATDTSTTIYVTVNKSDRVTRKVRCAATAPVKTQTATCPTGYTGTNWQQVMSYTLQPSPTCWVESGWEPLEPPAGICIKDWTSVAVEGGRFTLTEPRIVRFGAGLLWTEKTLAAGVWNCNVAFWGDPARNVPKTCEAKAGVVVIPPKPVDEVRKITCVDPAVGEWEQVRPFIPDYTATYWTPGTWTPDTAPEGACVIPPPEPVPEPPPDMGGSMVYIDKTKIPPPAVGTSTLNVAATTEVALVSDGGSFRTICTMAKMAFDDPIVFPGKPGASHLHVEFGNTGFDAYSTAESLRTTGNSTCRGGIANRSAYWVPAMIDTKDGTPLVPTDIGTYYKNGKLPSEVIQPIPEGLMMIAGNPTLTGPNPAGTYAARFKCIGGPNNQNDLYGASIGNCDAGAHLVSEVFFPQCWNGVNLDSDDHKKHMSYTVTKKDAAGVSYRTCPDTHPVPLPEVTFNIVYQVTEQDAPLRWRLASDMYDKSLPGGYSSHGDLLFGWKLDISDTWAKHCVQAKRDCHSHLLGDGRKIF